MLSASARLSAEIRLLYDRSDATTRVRGRRWYATEHAYAVCLSKSADRPVRLIAACLAVLSPRCQWPRVKAACEELLAGRTPAGIFNRNLAKARDILASHNGLPIYPDTAPKTWAFWQNLWRPDDPEPVTLDSWMFRAHGLSVRSGIRTYRALADAYRSAAGELGLVPNQLQATIWLHMKERA
jgi:hypothetical protein